jgi:NAD(P)H-flavin reductase
MLTIAKEVNLSQAEVQLKGRVVVAGDGHHYLPRAYIVTARKRETADTVTLTLKPKDSISDAWQLPEPGQFNMLYVFAVGEIPVSICGVDSDGAFLHTIRRVGAVSSALCDSKVGSTVGVRGAYGVGWPVERMKHRSLIILAGGLGLAPLLMLIRQVVRIRSDFAEITICIGARTPRDLPFLKEILSWQRLKCDTGIFDVRLIVDRADREWRGEVGVVTALLPRSLTAPELSLAMICGPEVMMRHAASDLVRLGLSRSDIYLSLERNMKCAFGLCGHCQLNRYFVCRDGPIFSFEKVESLLNVKDL